MPSGTLHFIDTNVLVNIRDEHRDSREIWHRLFEEIEAGRLKTVRQVDDEVKSRWPDVYKQIKPYKKKFVVPDSETYALAVITEIRAIRASHPNLYPELCPKNPADPWLIGLAKANDGIVITDEKTQGPRHQSKIPWVCKSRNVGCMSRLVYFRELGIDV